MTFYLPSGIMDREVDRMNDTRIPVQKRSIEKRKRILEAGFQLFCEKGYYKTNTIEIARHAKVSTGTVYSYFKDKKEIYMGAYETYLDSISTQLFERLDKVQPFCLEYFVNHWISAYLELYSGAGHALVQLRMMIMDDAEISQHFSGLENKYFLKIGEILGRNGNTQNNRSEKVYISCVLIDSLRQEKSAFTHNGLDFEALKQQVAKTVVRLLSE